MTGRNGPGDEAPHDGSDADDFDAGDFDARWDDIVADLSEDPGPRDWAPEEVEEHFEEPDPPAVLGGSPLLTMAWAGAIGAPLAIVLCLILWPAAPAIVFQVAGVVLMASAATLIWQLPSRRDQDDDGAAV